MFGRNFVEYDEFKIDAVQHEADQFGANPYEAEYEADQFGANPYEAEYESEYESEFKFEHCRCPHCERIINFDEAPAMDRANPWCSYCGRKKLDDWRCGPCGRSNYHLNAFCEGCYADRTVIDVSIVRVDSIQNGNKCVVWAFIYANDAHQFLPGMRFDNSAEFMQFLVDLGLASIVSAKTLRELTSGETVGDDVINAIAGLLNVSVTLHREGRQIDIASYPHSKRINILHTTNPDHYEFIF